MRVSDPLTSRRAVIRRAALMALSTIVAACSRRGTTTSTSTIPTSISAVSESTAPLSIPVPPPSPTARVSPPATRPATPRPSPNPTAIVPTPTPSLIPANPALLADLSKLAIPLTTLDPSDAFDGLQMLKTLIGDARIVGLGEATHGTHEFQLMKHRVVRFLVQEMGFALVAMEVPWATALTVADFLETGSDSDGDLVTSLYYWPWQTQEVLDMVHWLRRFHETMAAPLQPSFAGFDASGNHTAIQRVLSYVQQVEPAALPRFQRYYAGFDRWGSAVSDTASADAQQAVTDLLQHSDDFTRPSSTVAYADVVQTARSVVQSIEIGRAQNGDDVRDQIMATNIAWLLEQMEDRKIVLWAHNDHIGSQVYNTFTSMGTHVKARYGTSYCSIGFTFFDGYFLTNTGAQIAPLPASNSYEYTFRQLDLPLFVVNLQHLSNGSLAAEWIRQPHRMWSFGVGYPFQFSDPDSVSPVLRLPDTFDALIYVQTSTPSRRLR